MDNSRIISTMNTYLHKATEDLVFWLENILPQTSDNWWYECILRNLSMNQREMAESKGFANIADFDLAALLRVTDRSWYQLRGTNNYLPASKRDCIRDMTRVRNNWAHIGSNLPGKDAIVADLNTLYNFFSEYSSDKSILQEIDISIGNIKNTTDIVEDIDEEHGKELINVAETVEDEIKPMDQVYIVSQPDLHGLVMNVEEVSGTKKYTVFVNGTPQVYYSGSIASLNKKVKNNWVDLATFRSYLAAYQINNPSARNLYSLNAARIDFVPYQFKPALKMIHADEPRILIADSVGVGKTIEAGLIIKELSARKELENIVVICPKPLVQERKWEMEMKRFDEDFVAIDGDGLRQIISDTHRDGEWPLRANKIIIPYSILDSRTFDSADSTNKKGKRREYGLMDITDPAPHFDLVIIDEAHHIRNGSLEQEKAYAYKCVRFFCEHADAVVMLTATPLQTSNRDLFTLMNVLRPDVIVDEDTFNVMMAPNEFVYRCSRILRGASENWKDEALKELTNILTTQWGERVISANPVYISARKILQQDTVSDEERVKLISDIESLHSFNTMLNRTRRRDIQDFCVRNTETLKVNFTPIQKELHDSLLEFEIMALSQIHESRANIAFMISTLKRQAASCIFGLAPHIKGLIARRFAQLSDDPDTSYAEFSFKEDSSDKLIQMGYQLIEKAKNLPADDPKFDLMMTAIKKKQSQKNNKIIIFSTFRYTLAYLKSKLEDNGLRVGQVDGSVKDEDRQLMRERFELPKSDKDAIDILLFTEVGSEGLDYQFCNMMINYDLPWNPMKIEQRIGRIDRRGQQSEAVTIINMVTDGTVDADIYYRCLERIGVFQASIGECEEILGDIASKIEKIAIDNTLTETQRREKLRQVADNEIRKIQAENMLEDEKRQFFGLDLSENTTSKEIQEAENPWLTPSGIRTMVENYLADVLGKGEYIVGEKDIKTLRLSREDREKLREDLKKLHGTRNAVRQVWDAFLKSTTPYHTITFEGESAEKNREAFLVNAMHPLAKQAAKHYDLADKAYIRVQYGSEELPTGTYHFSVYAWSFVGVSPRFKLVIVCDNDKIAEELSDILQESLNGGEPVKMDVKSWEPLEAKQIEMWKTAKQDLLKESEITTSYKIESLKNNYENTIRSLEQRLFDASHENIRRMISSQIENVRADYEKKISSLRQQFEQTDIHSTLIADGIIEII